MCATAGPTWQVSKSCAAGATQMASFRRPAVFALQIIVSSDAIASGKPLKFKAFKAVAYPVSMQHPLALLVAATVSCRLSLSLVTVVSRRRRSLLTAGRVPSSVVAGGRVHGQHSSARRGRLRPDLPRMRGGPQRPRPVRMGTKVGGVDVIHSSNRRRRR